MSCTCKYSLSAIMLACLFALTSVAQAQDDDQQNEAQRWVNQLSEKVDLNEEQKSEIRQTIEKHNEKIKAEWAKFSKAHMSTVTMQASLYAALEENMTTQQQQQFRRNRDRQEQSQKTQTAQNEGQKKLRETQYRENRSSEQTETSSKNDYRQRKQQSGESDPADYYVTTMIFVPVERNLSSMGMDPQKQSQCNQTCQEFKSKLTNAWKAVHQHHFQMVKLEAEKIQAIEDTLNEEQLKKLRENNNDSDNQNSDNQNSDN